jgi:hypothetical protein
MRVSPPAFGIKYFFVHHALYVHRVLYVHLILPHGLKIKVEKISQLIYHYTMINQADAGADIKPDILIPYNADADGEALLNSAIAVISVRPETNKVIYEAAIIHAISPYASVVYLASLSGNLINDRAIIAAHYSSQLQFAIEGKSEMGKYPEMIKTFEEKFHVRFDDAKIIGAFEAVLEYKVASDFEELFTTIVPDTDFIEFYGQTIKKIAGFYVLNYDIPAIITRHHDDTAMFIIAIRLKDNTRSFSDLHHLIYERMSQNRNTGLIGPQVQQELPMAWYNRVRRTYHMSRSHIEAMFDLTDYVFKNNRERIHFAATPLGQKLLQRNIIPATELEERLSQLKENPLVYLKQTNGSLKLVDIILEGKSKHDSTFTENSLDECSQLFAQIDWCRDNLK